jgi:hypothetical protein
MENFQFRLLTYRFGAHIFLREVVPDVVTWCGSLRNMFVSHAVPRHTYGTSRKLFFVTPLALHTRPLSCISDCVGQPRPLASSTHFTPTLTLTIKCWIGRNKFFVQNNTVDWNSARSQRSETQSVAVNGALQKKWMADIGLFIVACHHIIAA